MRINMHAWLNDLHQHLAQKVDVPVVTNLDNFLPFPHVLLDGQVDHQALGKATGHISISVVVSMEEGQDDKALSTILQEALSIPFASDHGLGMTKLLKQNSKTDKKVKSTTLVYDVMIMENIR